MYTVAEIARSTPEILAKRLDLLPEAAQKLIGDAVAECLLDARAACGVLVVDETRYCLSIR